MAVRRYAYRMHHQWLSTYRIGYCAPFFIQEVVPGDTWAGSSFAMFRLAPTARPVFAALKMHCHMFFVPHRIVWPDWEDFITGEKDVKTPKVTVPNQGSAYNTATLLKWLGISQGTADYTINALPIRAYNLCWNEYLRDQHEDTPVDLDQLTNLPTRFPATDYIGSMRSSIQRGDEEIVDVSGGSLSITKLRDAQHRQRFKERRSQFGTRYVDYLAAMGIRAPSSRLDRPEHVARSSFTMGISEVLSTATTTDDTVGNMRGHGITGGRIRFPKKMFVEHGTLIGICYVRPRNQVTTGVDALYFRDEKEDFFQQELARDTQVPVRVKEFTTQDGPNWDSIVGYTARDEWLRKPRDTVGGRFRDTANYEWTMHRQITSAPTVKSLLEVPEYTYIFQDQTAERLETLAYFDHAIGARRLVPRRQR